MFDASDENIKIFRESMDHNYFLLDCRILKDEYLLKNMQPYRERNEQFNKEWTELKQNMVVLLHNMARNAETIRKLLPIEIWLEIFKRITHPCSSNNGFQSTAMNIFKNYKLF